MYLQSTDTPFNSNAAWHLQPRAHDLNLSALPSRPKYVFKNQLSTHTNVINRRVRSFKQHICVYIACRDGQNNRLQLQKQITTTGT